jgi:hypothetical protein
MTSSTQMDVYKEWLGIPEGERPPDHYTLLRLVKFEDDEEKIRRNYTKLNNHVRKYATGQYAKESQTLLNELAKAMLCLTDPQRKPDYDASMGREVDKKPEAVERHTLGEVLVAEGKISDDQRKEAENFAEARGLSMRDAVVQMKLVDTDAATRAFAHELGYSYVDLANTMPDDSVLDKVPRNLVRRHAILPLFEDDGTLLVACVHEPTPDLEEELRLRYGVPMRPVLATPLAINQGISKYYAPGMRDEAVESAEQAGDGKKGRAKPKPAKAKPAGNAPRKAVSQLSPDELRERKLKGILFINAAIIGSVMIDTFVIFKFLIRPAPIAWLPFLLTFIIPPLVALWVWKVFWK